MSNINEWSKIWIAPISLINTQSCDTIGQGIWEWTNAIYDEAKPIERYNQYQLTNSHYPALVHLLEGSYSTSYVG